MSGPVAESAAGAKVGAALNADLLTRFSESALAQARNYLIVGGVFNGQITATPIGQLIQADVRRSAARHYHVTIQSSVGGEVSWFCTCPFTAQNCEHTAAVLQAWLQEPQRFTAVPGQAPIFLPTAPPTTGAEPPVAATASDPAPIPRGAVMRITPDLQIHLRRTNVPAALSKLVEALAEPLEMTGQYRVYQVTGQRLQTVLQEGRSIEEILSTLAKASDDELPAAARTRLQGWADAQDTFHLYDNLPVVEFADDFTLQELLRVGGIRQYLLHIFSPRLVAVHPRYVNDLITEMDRRGLMPKVES